MSFPSGLNVYHPVKLSGRLVNANPGVPGIPGPVPGVPVNAFPGIVSVVPVFGFVKTAVCNCIANDPECALVDLLIDGPPAQPSTVSKGAGGFVAQVSNPLFGIDCELARREIEERNAIRNRGLYI